MFVLITMQINWRHTNTFGRSRFVTPNALPVWPKIKKISVRELAGGNLDFLRSDWLLERAVFSHLLTTVNGILASWVYFASEDAKVWVKSLLTQWRSGNLRDTQILISGFNMKAFPLLFVWQPWTSVSLKFISLTSRVLSDSIQIAWTVLVHFMISVLSLGFIFIEEIEPCQWFEIQNFSVASSMMF